MSTRGTAELDALIEKATVETFDEVEAVNGFLAVIDEYLAVPFATTVLERPGQAARRGGGRHEHRHRSRTGPTT
ncbi:MULTISPECIES: hypothetical protein [Streptomycetaceae]|uniref:hypothetical protein n=1 Tax=Streptomycetaceae TaxID=2062 RepID=UPI003008DD2A